MSCTHDASRYKGKSDWTCLKQSIDYYRGKCPAGTHSDGKIYGSKFYGGTMCAGDTLKNIFYPSQGYNFKTRYYTKCYYNRPEASKMSLANKVKCCTGQHTRQDQCPASLCRNSDACDKVMLDYCKDRPDDPLCGCALDAKHYGALKTIGPLQCVDKRCTNPAAYKLTSQREPCNLTQCIVGDITLSAEDLANIDDFALSQNCGEDFLKKLEEQGKESETAPTENGTTDESWFSWIGLNGDDTPDQQPSNGTTTTPTEKKETNVVMWISIVIGIILLILTGYFLLFR